jgi:hypothetical protein
MGASESGDGSKLNINQLTESIFGLDTRIRYVAILDGRYDLIQSKMRNGLSSITPDATDREFMSVVPAIVLDAVEQLIRYCGDLSRVTVRYEKVVLVFYQVANKTVALSVEPRVDMDFLDKTGESIRRLVASTED